MKERFSRKEFIKLAGSAGLSAGALLGQGVLKKAEASGGQEKAEYNLNKPRNIINTVCLQCNTGCSIKVKILDGLAVKIDGNPYSPWTMWPHIPYKTPLVTAAAVDGHICPKGQSGIQTLYDPYRIRKVLKRAGKRGENKWVSISFEQAVKEIVEGAGSLAMRQEKKIGRLKD